MNANPLPRGVATFLRSGTVLLLALLLAGCETAREYSLTYKLWDKGMRSSCRPAEEPRVAVFASKTNYDVFVAYDALSERHDRIERRAYSIYENRERILMRQPPSYINLSAATNSNPVPLINTTNALTNVGLIALYPVSTDTGPGIELYREGRSEGTHGLPVYEDETLGTASRVVLTPLAITGDTLMVGAVIGTLGALIWIQAGCPPFGH